MANYLQTEFNKFHENIKLTDIDENKELRDKRDMLTKELRDYFDKKYSESIDPNEKKITFSFENQGSYSMQTGIKPIDDDEDYDIDIMILFNISKDDYTPVEVKKWVEEALSGKNREVEQKKPCVRVQYRKDGEPRFHVDLALYANSNPDEKTYISKGKDTSPTNEKLWELSDPKELKKKINTKYDDADDRMQMKRVIRYLKRWKDFKFKNTKDGKPTGILLTAFAYNLFNAEIERNSFSGGMTPKDLLAFRKLVNSILGQFHGWNNDKISVKLPVDPGNDLFDKMSDNQKKVFKEKVEKLRDAIEKAENEPDPHEASKILRKQFGEDFPEIDKDDSAQKRKRAFPGKSESA